VREALGDDRGALTLESRDLRAQRRTCGALVDRPRHTAVEHACTFRSGKALTSSRGPPSLPNLPIDDLLLVVGHTRLLAGRIRFYQCVRRRGDG
jgi:hypothetical protein